jgi:uncharacterized protein (DUF1697 family)
MPRYVALLRGINVGGHRVKMDELRRHFTALKFANVGTFIASGNVIFDAASTDVPALETKIERRLAKELGFEVPTILRTITELATLAARQPFAPADTDVPEYSYYVFLLREATAGLAETMAGFRSKYDEFHTEGREVYWLCRGKISEVSLAWQPMEKAFKNSRAAATSRNLRTIRQIVAQYGPGDSPSAPIAEKPKRKRAK